MGQVIAVKVASNTYGIGLSFHGSAVTKVAKTITAISTYTIAAIASRLKHTSKNITPPIAHSAGNVVVYHLEFRAYHPEDPKVLLGLHN